MSADGACWAVGVTTVPQRRAALLPATLASLRAAGWGEGEARLFVDGDPDGASWEREFGLPVTCRTPALGVSGNWFVSLWELYWRHPHAQRYMLVQDDVAFLRNVRQYLDATPYPEGSYLNLYADRVSEEVIHGKRAGTWHEGAAVDPERCPHAFRDGEGRLQQRGRGALALAFDQAAVQALLSHPHMLRKPKDPANGSRLIDGAVVESMNRAGLREVVHCPSLCQHRGDESTIRVACRDVATGEVSVRPKPRAPRALSFMGEDFDAMRFIQLRER
jgi:hypothetical protein